MTHRVAHHAAFSMPRYGVCRYDILLILLGVLLAVMIAPHGPP